MEDDIVKDEEENELDLRIPPEIEKVGDILGEDTENIDELAEEEEEEEPFDDVNLI